MDEVTIRLHVEPLKEGGYLATSPDVPGLIAEGRSVTETVEIAQDVARKIAESCLEHGDPLPPALAGNGNQPVAVDLLVPVGMCWWAGSPGSNTAKWSDGSARSDPFSIAPRLAAMRSGGTLHPEEK